MKRSKYLYAISKALIRLPPKGHLVSRDIIAIKLKVDGWDVNDEDYYLGMSGYVYKRELRLSLSLMRRLLGDSYLQYTYEKTKIGNMVFYGRKSVNLSILTNRPETGTK